MTGRSIFPKRHNASVFETQGTDCQVLPRASDDGGIQRNALEGWDAATLLPKRYGTTAS